MKAVLISIQPKWCELISSGKKTVEVRKTKPKLETPFKCYIYETKGETETPWMDEEGHMIFRGRGMVIGEFVCDKIEHIEIRHFTVFGHENRYAAVGDNPDHQWLKKSCLSYDEVVHYGKMAPLYGWHISDLVIYEQPKPLSDFIKCNYPWDCGVCDYYDSLALSCNKPKRPPQSWCYVEECE